MSHSTRMLMMHRAKAKSDTLVCDAEVQKIEAYFYDYADTNFLLTINLVHGKLTSL